MRLLTLPLALLAGCSRSFSAPPPPPSPELAELGTPCTDAGACGSGFCVDGVCCSGACSASQACDTPGFRGVCTERANGSSCTADAQCPNQHCVDGVCCNDACAGGCRSCAVEGSVGQCQVVPDNTDPRHACGSCMACFSGVCGAAEPGSDPQGECDGGWCNAAGLCAAASSQACAVDEDCAVGTCLAGLCARSAFSYFDGQPFLPTEQARAPIAAAAGADGASAVLVLTDLYPDSEGDRGYLVALVAPSQTSPWKAVPLSYNQESDDVGSGLLIGHAAFFATGHRYRQGSGPTDIVLRGVTVDGNELGIQTISPDAGYITDIALGADPNGTFLVGFKTTPDQHVYVGARVPGESWSLADVGSNAGGIGIANLGSGAVALYMADGGMHARDTSGQDVSEPPLPAACPGLSGNNYLAVSAVHRGDHDVAAFAVWCDAPTNSYFLGSYDPNGTPAWQVHPAPDALPGESQIDIDYLVPVGGRGDATFYLAYMNYADSLYNLDQPRGGYLSFMWTAPDGGVGSLGAFAPDPGFGYFHCTGAGTPDGLPFAVCDTGLLDTSNGSDIRLLFMRFSN